MSIKTILFKYNIIKKSEVEKNPEILKNPNLDKIVNITDDVVKYASDAIIEENKIIPDFNKYVKTVCDKDRFPIAYMVVNDTKGFEKLIGKKALDYANELLTMIKEENGENTKLYHNFNEDDVINEDTKYYTVILDNGDVCLIKEHNNNIEYVNKTDKFILLDYVRMIDLTPKLRDKDIDESEYLNKLIFTNDELNKLKEKLELPDDLTIKEGDEVVYITKINVPDVQNKRDSKES